MKFRYPFRDCPPSFRVLTRPGLKRMDRPDFGTMVSYEAHPGTSATLGVTTLDVNAASGEPTCAFRFGVGTAQNFACQVRLPAKLVGKDATPSIAVLLNHLLAPVCVGSLVPDTTYVDWEDVKDWLRANPRLLLGCGSGSSVLSAYASARDSLDGYLDAHPSAEVFIVGYCPSNVSFPEGFRSVRAAWGDRIVMHGFPAVEAGNVMVSLLVVEMPEQSRTLRT